ncbi:hypothetical protein C0992_004383 [Termitomyces sp. T32_za158]|nr:hypothetical protein C0992_004383 [Termitomyces sp. T32_za158]
MSDPLVARRVRVLHVYPVFLHQLSHRPARSLRHRLAALIQREPRLSSPTDIVQAMLHVFARLPNLTDYHIMWSGLQPIPASPVPFLSAVFRSNLRKLALDISLENIATLLCPASAPHSIQELDLVIRVDSPCPHPHHAAILADHLAPSIARLQHSLRHLALQAWDPLDFSPLFRALSPSLAPLPLLTHLSLAIPIEPPHLGDPTALAAFLSHQSLTLRTLTLRATHHAGPVAPPAPASFASWLSTALACATRIDAEALDISSPLFPPPGALVVLAALGAGLTRLNLTGSFRAYDDVERVLGALRAHGGGGVRLESLRIGTVRLTPALVDLLARALPSLTSLEMIVRDVALCEDEPASPDPDGFCEAMEGRRYDAWGLCRVGIVFTAAPAAAGVSWRGCCAARVERVLVRCVPAVRGGRAS